MHAREHGTSLNGQVVVRAEVAAGQSSFVRLRTSSADPGGGVEEVVPPGRDSRRRTLGGVTRGRATPQKSIPGGAERADREVLRQAQDRFCRARTESRTRTGARNPDQGPGHRRNVRSARLLTYDWGVSPEVGRHHGKGFPAARNGQTGRSFVRLRTGSAAHEQRVAPEPGLETRTKVRATGETSGAQGS